MCFSNLPVEFDDDGNPYLAEEADDVRRPGVDSGNLPDDVVDGLACDCGAAGAPGDLTTDPEGAYEAIVDSLPDAAREHLEGDVADSGTTDPGKPDSESAESD